MNQNPYAATKQETAVSDSAIDRYRIAALSLATIVIAGTGIDFHIHLADFLQTGEGIHPVALTVFLCFLAAMAFLVFVELFGAERSMNFVPFVLAPLLLLSLPAFIGLVTNLSNYLTLTWMQQNPSTVAGWLACPIIWYYFAMSILRWRRLKLQKKANHGLHADASS